MGSVLAKLLDYGGFRDCGCAQGFPLSVQYSGVVRKHHRVKIEALVFLVFNPVASCLIL